MMFTGKDRVSFDAWLDRCIALGVLGDANTMTGAIRLAVRLAQAQTDDQIRMGSTRNA